LFSSHEGYQFVVFFALYRSFQVSFSIVRARRATVLYIAVRRTTRPCHYLHCWDGQLNTVPLAMRTRGRTWRDDNLQHRVTFDLAKQHFVRGQLSSYPQFLQP
jgi:hypothetical protein